jgi:hypothetical protein
MRLARGIVVMAMVMAAGVAAAQEAPGIQLAASAGVMGGQGPFMLGGQAGVAYPVVKGRIEIRYLVEYYGSGSYAYRFGGGCLDTCLASSARSQLMGTAIGARFNLFPSDPAPYLLATVGLYQSRLRVNTPANQYEAATQRDFLDTGLGAGGGVGMNFNVGGAQLFGELQFLYTNLGRTTRNNAIMIPITVGIGF